METIELIYRGDPQFEIFTPQKWGQPTVFEIDTCNFQQMLDLGFSQTSQNFSSLRQLFFHSFQGRTKGKKLKKRCIVLAIFQHESL